MKKRIEDVIVVEGVHDLQKLQSIYDVDVLYTNGSAVSKEFIEKLQILIQKRSVIVFTDPDFPGKKIRQTIMEAIPDVKHAFIDKTLALGKGKVGVEHASVEDIQYALEHVVSPLKVTCSEITWADLISRDLIIGEKAKEKREYISKCLHLGHLNSKQFYKHLVLFGITLEQIDKIIEEF